MKNIFQQELSRLQIKEQVSVEFIHIPPYSPYLNVAEYFIRIIRQKFLNHCPSGQNIDQLVKQLIDKVHLKKLLNQQQVNNIIRRATNLANSKTTSFSPKRE